MIMAQLVADCPRCKAQKTTFDVLSDKPIYMHYGWQVYYEAFSICRHCQRSTVFVLSSKDGSKQKEIHDNIQLSNFNGSLNRLVDIKSYVSLKDEVGIEPPEHLPENMRAAFVEGATCLAVKCYNAAGTMFRLCEDLATRPLLPEEDQNGLNAKIRRDLGLRLPWLFGRGILPVGLRDLAICIKDDGNDGAHAGTLQKEEAEDLMDFAYELLERLYTEPKRLELAKQRREDRRKPKNEGEPGEQEAAEVPGGIKLSKVEGKK